MAFGAFSIVNCDLLDLYVKDMDDAMRTAVYENVRNHPRDVAGKLDRSAARRADPFRIGILRRQRLEVDENYWPVSKANKHKEERRSRDESESFENAFEVEKKYFTNGNDAVERKNFEKENDEVGRNIFDKENDELARDDGSRIGRAGGEPLAEIFEVNADKIETRPFEEPVIKRNPNRWHARPKKYYPPAAKKSLAAADKVNEEFTVEIENGRSKRNAVPANFTRHEVLDDAGDVLLQWDPNDEETVTFKVTAKTLGYVGVGFNDRSHMKGADILVAWVDDHTGVVNLVVNRVPESLYHSVKPT